MFKNNNEKGEIEYHELKAAEKTIITIVQMSCFNSFFEESSSDPRIEIWGIINHNGILRCQGRIMQTYPGKESPILLPSGDKVTKLLIEEIHKKLKHGIYISII